MPGTRDETVNVEVTEPPDERVTLAGLNVALSPAAETVELRLTGPESAFRLARVTVEVVADPDETTREVGLAEIVKSGPLTTVTVMVTVWVRDPLVARTVKL